MRVAITHPYSWPDVRRGAERIIVETGRALAARGHDVTVLTSGGDASRTTDAGVTIVRFRRLFDSSNRHERWFAQRIVPSLVRGRFDVVHSLMPRDAVAAIRTRRITGHRTVYQELGNPVRDKVLLRRDGDTRERVIREVDVFGCMSEFSRGFLEREWGRAGALIPGGVRISEFSPTTREERPTILFSGAIERPEKNVRELLDAVAVLAGERPDVQLFLSGPGDASALLADAPAAARDRTVVLPIGEPGQLALDYARSWVTCLPTLWDSFGLVVIESMAAGTPVVCGPAGAPPEVVEPGVGTIARALDPQTLAEALSCGLSQAEDPSTATRCRRVAERFDWDQHHAPLLERLYESDERL